MSVALEKFLRIFFEPFAVLALIALGFFMRQYFLTRKMKFMYVLLTAFFLLGWRFACRLAVSRYYLGALIPAILWTAYMLSAWMEKSPRWRRAVWMATACLVVAFILKGGYVNIYNRHIFDGVPASFYDPASSDKTVLLCPVKEIQRLRMQLPKTTRTRILPYELPEKTPSLDAAVEYLVYCTPQKREARYFLLPWAYSENLHFDKEYPTGRVVLLRHDRYTKSQKQQMLLFYFEPEERSLQKKMICRARFEEEKISIPQAGYAANLRKNGAVFYQEARTYPTEVDFHFGFSVPGEFYEAFVTHDPGLTISGKGSLKIKTGETLYVFMSRIPCALYEAGLKARAIGKAGKIEIRLFLYHDVKGWNGNIKIAECFLPADETVTINRIFTASKFIPPEFSSFRIVFAVEDADVIFDDIEIDRVFDVSSPQKEVKNEL